MLKVQHKFHNIFSYIIRLKIFDNRLKIYIVKHLNLRVTNQ